MTITTSTPALYAQRNSVASPQAAASEGSALDKFERGEKEAKKNSLWGKMGLTAIGVGSVFGTVGWALKSFTGWANAFPVMTMVGLGAGALLGMAAWAIEHKQRQDEKKAAREAQQAPPPVQPPAPQSGAPRIEIN